SFDVRGRTYARPSDAPAAEVREVSTDFFHVLGIPLLRGRGFDATDLPNAPRVYVVNEAFAKRFFANQDVLQQEIRLGWGRDPQGQMNRIVGVVGDVHSFGLDQEPEPTVYAAAMQYPTNGLTIVIRAANT